jgi:peptidoglycan hydrolase CwlO-like protein
MATQGDRESEIEPNFPPGLGKNDLFLYREIAKVSSQMNEIVKVVNAVPSSIDAKIEPVNRQLETIVQTIESFARLPENVEKIREESTAFLSFRDRIEGHENAIRNLVKKYAWRVTAAVLLAAGSVVITAVGGAFYLGTFLTTINGNVGEMKDSIGEMKDSIGKQEATTYELNGTTKAQGEHLKSMDEQLKAVQVSMRETAIKVAESSDKASDRIAGIVGGKIDALERKIEETSDVLVFSLTLTPGDKPEFKSETHVIYEMPIPPRQRRSGGTKAFQAGAVSFLDGDTLFRPSGVVANAYPKQEHIIVIELFFQDKSAFEGFMKRLSERRSIRLKITLSLG